MINDEHHVALPKLYGAPAYARPPRPVAEEAPRPPDEDDLPLEAFRVLDDPQEHASSTGVHGSGNGNGSVAAAEQTAALEGRPFSLRALSRFISGR